MDKAREDLDITMDREETIKSISYSKAITKMSSEVPPQKQMGRNLKQAPGI